MNMTSIWKTGYIAENARKSLIRTPGILGTAALVFVLSLITFCGINGFYLLSHWYQDVAAQFSEATKDTNSVIQLMQAPLIPIRIFQGLALLVSLCAGVTTVAYCHRSFRLFAVTQQQDFRIMSLLGESTAVISGEFALQSTMFLTVALGISSIGADMLYWFTLAPGACRDTFGSLAEMIARLLPYHLPLLAIAICYVALRLFAYIRRLLWSWLDNQKSATNYV